MSLVVCLGLCAIITLKEVIVLTKEQYKHLRLLRKNKSAFPKEEIDSFCRLGYATRDVAYCDKEGCYVYADTATITDLGIETLESRRRETFRYWFPNVISAAALALSIIALLSD